MSMGTLLCSWEQVKIRMMDTPTLINKMHGSLEPSDRDFALDACESVWRRVRFWPTRKRSLTAIYEFSGVDMLLDVLKVWMQDIPVAVSAIRALTKIVRHSQSEADHILELGGLMLTEDCKNAHSDDREVQDATNDLTTVLTQRSSALAEREIRLCCACAIHNVDMQCGAELGRIMSANRTQRAGSAVDGASRRRGAADLSTLVQTVLRHMRGHYWSVQVQDVGLDALTELCRRAENVESALLSCNAPEVVVEAMSKHPKSARIQWKACLAITFMASQPPLSSDLGKRGVVKALKFTFETFRSDIEVQQQAVWALGSLSNVQTNIERFHTERIQACVVDVLRRDKDPKIRIEEKIAMPLNLRCIWTNKQLEDMIYKAESDTVKKRTIRKGNDNHAKVQVFAALNPVARKGKGKYNRVSDEFGSGTSGLID